ncbi:MAG: flagellar basal body P-ring protein FlgI [Deltaproteobacteria bacterium]|nr:flagellar basal body P-ring protein FlgI [Deltaproteobacteria bacterium]
MKAKMKSVCGMVMIFCFLFDASSYGARVKDIAGISGVRDNQLIGYGLVVGLAGTGDDVKNGFTKESLANMLSRQGLAMKDKTLKAENAAAVMVTATLPPFIKTGSQLDVFVSSIGNSKSLYGGTLLMVPLRGADGEIYAVAQGPITLGGFAAGGGGGSSVKNHPSAGRIANGALVEKQLRYDFEKSRTLSINLYNPDFTTSSRLAASINSAIKNVAAKEEDSFSVSIKLPEDGRVNIFELISQIENLDVPVDSRAVVVMNEKTGTVVMGENVRIATVAIAHGNLSIQIKEDIHVSQPLPFAPSPPLGGVPRTGKEGEVIVAPGGQTVVTTDKTTTVNEEKKQLMVVPRGVTIQDVVKALNAVGVTPRDLITIMQTIKAAGALQADLRII